MGWSEAGASPPAPVGAGRRPGGRRTRGSVRVPGGTGLTVAVAAAAAIATASLSTTGCRAERSLEVTATASNSVRGQTDRRPDEAAWGDVLRPGMRAIAVSRDLEERGLTRGTKVRIEGLDGRWTVLDRTSRRHRRTIDLSMGEDVDRAREWGVRRVRIYWTPCGG